MSEKNGTSPMSRRAFAVRLPVLAAGASVGLATLSLSGCAAAPYLVGRPHPRGLSLRTMELGSEGSAFVQSADMERPIFVSRTGDGGYVAVLASCTHRGCQPEPVGERLVCPCHGSEFSFAGAVLEGPADRPLPTYPVETDGELLVVRVEGGAR